MAYQIFSKLVFTQQITIHIIIFMQATAETAAEKFCNGIYKVTQTFTVNWMLSYALQKKHVFSTGHIYLTIMHMLL